MAKNTQKGKSGSKTTTAPFVTDRYNGKNLGPLSAELLDLSTVTSAEHVTVACNFVGLQEWHDGQLTINILGNSIRGIVDGKQTYSKVLYGEVPYIRKDGSEGTRACNQITVNIRQANTDLGGEGAYYGRTAEEREATADTFWALVDRMNEINAQRSGLFEMVPHDLFDTFEWRPAGDGKDRLPIRLKLSASKDLSTVGRTIWTLEGFEED